jgi:hypothetical protein
MFFPADLVSFFNDSTVFLFFSNLQIEDSVTHVTS